MTTTPHSPAPGWYPDPGSPATLRWFDGAAWSAHVMPVPAAAPPPAPDPRFAPYRSVPAAPAAWSVTPSAYPAGPAYPAAGPPGGDLHELRWVIPVGRTWQSVVGGYVALFATVIWFLGPVALLLGISALQASAAGKGLGRGRAWFAVVVGALSSVALVLLVASWLR